MCHPDLLWAVSNTRYVDESRVLVGRPTGSDVSFGEVDGVVGCTRISIYYLLLPQTPLVVILHFLLTRIILTVKSLSLKFSFNIEDSCLPKLCNQ